MNLAVALVVGLAAGLHAATWGMFKDAPYEGFTWQTYFRSPVIAGVIAVVVAAAGNFPSTAAADIAVLFGLTYVIERGINEFYKTFLRQEDQSKYSIPMQLSVRGRVVTKRRTRLLAGLGQLAGCVVADCLKESIPRISIDA